MQTIMAATMAVALLCTAAVATAAQDTAPTTTTEELLSGMVTEEVEPGVLRVVNDGVQDLSSADYWGVFAGQDGSIWLPSHSGYLSRLGVAETHDWQLEEWYNLIDIEVAHDGTVWAVVVNEEESALLSFDGEARTIHRVGDLLGGLFGDVEITSDGVVWASLKQGTLSYIEDDGSTWHDIEWSLAVGPNTYHGPWFTLIGSDVWVADREDLWHYTDGAWQQIDYGAPDAQGLPEGVVWDRRAGGAGHYLYRHDETGSRQWSLGEHDMLPALYHWGKYDMAPDGSFWAGWAVYDSEEFRDRCEGVSRFDGRTWERHLPNMCIGAMDIAPDGSVWLTAWEGEDPDAWQVSLPDPELDLYVITPEAVAATE